MNNSIQYTRGEEMKKKVIGLIVVILLGAGIGVGHYFVNYALSPASNSNERNVKETVHASNSNEVIMMKNREKEAKKGDAFYKETSLTHIISKDSLKLYGNYKIQDSHKWALIIHGYKVDNKNMMPFGRTYYEHGYNVLLPDDRASGKSEGNHIGMGYLDKDDMKLWIKWILNKDPKAEIIVHGVSMGGATTMMLSGDNPKHVVGYIEDCGYTSVYDIFSSELYKRFGLPSFPVMDISNMMANIEAGYDFKEASSVKAVKKCKKPMMFIHGTKDDFVPYSMGLKVYKAAKYKKELYSVKGATHANSIYMNPNDYWNHVFNFINERTSISG